MGMTQSLVWSLWCVDGHDSIFSETHSKVFRNNSPFFTKFLWYPYILVSCDKNGGIRSCSIVRNVPPSPKWHQKRPHHQLVEFTTTPSTADWHPTFIIPDVPDTDQVDASVQDLDETKLEETEPTDESSTVSKLPTEHNYSAPLPPQKHTHTNTVISQDNFVFLGKYILYSYNLRQVFIINDLPSFKIIQIIAD